MKVSLLLKLLIAYSSLALFSLWWLLFGWRLGSNLPYDTTPQWLADREIKSRILENKDIEPFLSKMTDETEARLWKNWLKQRENIRQKLEIAVALGNIERGLTLLEQLGEMEKKRLDAPSDVFWSFNKKIAFLLREEQFLSQICDNVSTLDALLNCLDELKTREAKEYINRRLIAGKKKLNALILDTVVKEIPITEQSWEAVKKHSEGSATFRRIEKLRYQLNRLRNIPNENINARKAQLQDIKNTAQELNALNLKIDTLDFKIKEMEDIILKEESCIHTKSAFYRNEFDIPLPLAKRCLEKEQIKQIEYYHYHRKVTEVTNELEKQLDRNGLPTAQTYVQLKAQVESLLPNPNLETLWQKLEEKIEAQTNVKGSLQKEVLEILELRRSIHFRDIWNQQEKYRRYKALLTAASSKWPPANSLLEEFTREVSKEIERLITKENNTQKARELLKFIPKEELVYHQWRSILN